MAAIQKTIVAVMLADGRAEMVRRAIESFHKQMPVPDTKTVLLVLDSGKKPLRSLCEPYVVHIRHCKAGGETIGSLRNVANEIAVKTWSPSFIAHWDSDDWSHPRRLVEQTHNLRLKSYLAGVGYRNLPFWNGKEAWLYDSGNHGLCVGTSMFYRAEVWAANTFPSTNSGEDTRWQLDKHCKSYDSILHGGAATHPRMVAQLHKGNTSSRVIEGAREWRRAPEHDQYCREVMEL
jgi:hypothetical protein